MESRDILRAHSITYNISKLTFKQKEPAEVVKNKKNNATKDI
jgi:hypothetical protein